MYIKDNILHLHSLLTGIFFLGKVNSNFRKIYILRYTFSQLVPLLGLKMYIFLTLEFTLFYPNLCVASSGKLEEA